MNASVNEAASVLHERHRLASLGALVYPLMLQWFLLTALRPVYGIPFAFAASLAALAGPFSPLALASPGTHGQQAWARPVVNVARKHGGQRF